MRRELCFVLMPFEKKLDRESGELVDFDKIYRHLISPAVVDAGLSPYRADEELQGGIFHKKMFERLTLCQYAIADLSYANANVFYELGIRHARRPWSTVLIYQLKRPLPLDVAMDSALGYPVDLLDRPTETERLREQLTRRLHLAREKATDSPYFQLVTGISTPEVDHRRVDAMLESVDQETEASQAIAEAKRSGPSALRSVRDTLGDLIKDDPEVAVTLLLAFRSHQAWSDMIELIRGMSRVLSEALLVKEQNALALSRLGRWSEAMGILQQIVDRRPSSETFGLLGGVYKRQWLDAVKAGRAVKADGLLKLAEETYRKGFETDWRDPYPGVNAVTLRAVRGKTDDDFQELLYMVRYSVRQRLKQGTPEYWDYASDLQLSIIAGDRDRASDALQGLLIRAKERFETSTTLEGLQLLRPWCLERGQSAWLAEIESEVAEVLQDS